MSDFLFALKKSGVRQILKDKSARLFAGKTAVLFRAVLVQSSIRIQKIYNFKIISLRNLPVVRVMGRSNFYHASPEFLVDIAVGNNRNNAVCQRKL